MERKRNEIQGMKKGGNSLHGRRTGALVLTLALVLGIFAAPEIPGMTNPAGVKVEAKSGTDKKKPVIKFSGKSQITVEQNEVIKIPKTTAKDNKDGNVTKKISVTVKKGKTSYKSIATKIKKNKKVKFSSIGKYTVTYSVKDKAGNKATKKRYITVVEPKTENTTTEAPTSQTTEIPTTTEAPTTEAPTTTEQPTTENATTQTQVEKRPSIGIYQETVNGVTYNITRDWQVFEKLNMEEAPMKSDKLTINIMNDFEYLYMDISANATGTSQYIKYLGSITATDENGVDISDKIIIYEPGPYSMVDDGGPVVIYVSDDKGNTLVTKIMLEIRDYKNFVYSEQIEEELEIISNDPLVYGKRRVKTEQ